MTLLAVQPAHALAVQRPEHRWLIEDLWAADAVGIVGGEPKCGKSFLALDVAVVVVSGAPCLRRFRPARTGRVLLFAAEDALHVVRARLVGIARAAGVGFETLDLHVITAPTLRLDLPEDQARLRDTVAALRPTLLVLDPFVRLHRIDENAAAEVAPVLAYLRELERVARHVKARKFRPARRSALTGLRLPPARPAVGAVGRGRVPLGMFFASVRRSCEGPGRRSLAPPR
jgi:hypothetical protein